MKRQNIEIQKSAIISYLDAKPLSTLREISDNYASKRQNYRVVKNIVEELIKEEKLGFINHKKIKSYFIEPTFPKLTETILKILSSQKINLLRFKKLRYDNWKSDWTFSQAVHDLICLFHLDSKLQKSNLLFKEDTIEYWKSWQKLCDPQPTSKASFLSMLEATISYFYELVKKRYKFLSPANKILLKKRLELMSAKSEQNNYRDAADLHKTGNKNIRKLLKSITDEQGNFSWYKAYLFQEMEGNSIEPDPEIIKLMIKLNATTDAITNYICATQQIIAFDEEGIKRFNDTLDYLFKRYPDIW